MLKRDEILAKLVDAKVLKDSIDERCHQVSGYFGLCLLKEEYANYQQLIVTKTNLKLKQQMIKDKIKLAEEQVKALQDQCDSCIS